MTEAVSFFFPPCSYLFYHDSKDSRFLKIPLPIYGTTPHRIPQGSNNWSSQSVSQECHVSRTLITHWTTGSLLYQTVKIFTDTQIYLLTIKSGGNSNWSEHLYFLPSHSVKTYIKTPPHNGLMKITRWDRLVRYAATLIATFCRRFCWCLLFWAGVIWAGLILLLLCRIWSCRQFVHFLLHDWSGWCMFWSWKQSCGAQPSAQLIFCTKNLRSKAMISGDCRKHGSERGEARKVGQTFSLQDKKDKFLHR